MTNRKLAQVTAYFAELRQVRTSGGTTGERFSCGLQSMRMTIFANIH